MAEQLENPEKIQNPDPELAIVNYFNAGDGGFAILEINNTIYLNDIMKKIKGRCLFTTFDISNSNKGITVANLKSTIQPLSNVILMGWNFVFPDNPAKYFNWSVNFGKLGMTFFDPKKKVVFCFSSLIVELLDQHSKEFTDLVTVRFDLKEVPSRYKDYDVDELKQFTASSSFIAKDAQKKINLINQKIEYGILEKSSKEEQADTFRELALNYQAMNNFEKALDSSAKVLEIQEEILSGEHIDMANTYKDISNSYLVMKDFNKSLEAIKKALIIQQKNLKENDLEFSKSYRQISTIFYRLGDYGKALEHANNAIAVLNANNLDPNHPDYATCFNHIAKIYRSIGDMLHSLDYLNRSLKICKTLPNASFETGQNLSDMSVVFTNLELYDKAMESIKQAINYHRRGQNDDHPAVASDYHNLSDIEKSIGEIKDALKSSKKSLEILEKILPKNHLYLATANNHISFIFHKLEISHAALAHIKKAIAIWEGHYPNGHPDLDYAYKLIYAIQNEERFY